MVHCRERNWGCFGHGTLWRKKLGLFRSMVKCEVWLWHPCVLKTSDVKIMMHPTVVNNIKRKDLSLLTFSFDATPFLSTKATTFLVVLTVDPAAAVLVLFTVVAVPTSASLSAYNANGK